MKDAIFSGSRKLKSKAVDGVVAEAQRERKEMADTKGQKDAEPTTESAPAEVMIEGDEDAEDEQDDDDEADDDFQFVLNEDDLDLAAAQPESQKSGATASSNSAADGKTAPAASGEPATDKTTGRPRSQSTTLAHATTRPASITTELHSEINASNYNDYMGQVYPPGVPRKRTAMDVNIDELTDHPWRRPGARLEDFFNYGLNERSWREYAARQIAKRVESQNKSKVPVFGAPQDSFQAPRPAPSTGHGYEQRGDQQFGRGQPDGYHQMHSHPPHYAVN